MSEKRYPTRMHEVLGVETEERFTVNEEDFGFVFWLDAGGCLVFDDPKAKRECRIAPDLIYLAINRGITRKPRLSEEQVRELKALVMLGKKWLAKDEDDFLAAVAFVKKPEKDEGRWWSDEVESDFIMAMSKNAAVNNLVSWSDPAPLDIVATLKAAGVEVE